jgi:hypothetical protein
MHNKLYQWVWIYLGKTVNSTFNIHVPAASTHGHLFLSMEIYNKTVDIII